MLIVESETSHWPFISCISVMAPPLQETTNSLQSVHSYGWNERDHRLWPILLPHHHQDSYWTHFSQSSEHTDTKMTFVWHTNQEKIDFVRDVSLSQQHILVRFALIHSHDIITLPDEVEAWWFLTVSMRHDSAHCGDRKCIYHLTLLAQHAMNDLVLMLTVFALVTHGQAVCNRFI